MYANKSFVWFPTREMICAVKSSKLTLASDSLKFSVAATNMLLLLILSMFPSELFLLFCERFGANVFLYPSACAYPNTSYFLLYWSVEGSLLLQMFEVFAPIPNKQILI